MSKKDYYIIFLKDKKHNIYLNDDPDICGHSYLHKGYIVTIPKRGRLSLYRVDAELYACGFLLEDAKVIKDQLNIYEATDK